MKAETTDLGVVLIEPAVFGDARGYFLETWSDARYAAAGVPGPFVQDNASWSSQGTLRGLHLQHPFGQGKLVQVLFGEVYDVAVDVRADSPTFGKFVGARLSAENHRQLYIPPGFAHGFCVTTDFALFSYKCTAPYRRDTELGVAWNDPALAIDWPIAAPLLSAKDAAFPRLAEIPRERLPRVE